MMRLVRLFRHFLGGRYIKVKHKDIWITLRRNGVDQEVFDYVFKDKYHRPLIPLPANPIILDLGTNIGLSIVDLKQIYPEAIIYGYELDAHNIYMARLNTKQLAKIFIDNVGIWYKKTKVPYSGSNSDAYKIDDSIRIEGHNLVNTTTIQNIVLQHKLDKIDYVKMDIEGAELEVFKNGSLEWLYITKQIKIEVHYGEEVFNFLKEKLEEFGFTTLKDTHHWSTIVGYRNES